MVFKVRSHRKTIYVISRGKWSYLISKATLTISARAFFIKPEAQNSSYCAERLFSCAWAWRFAPRCRSLGFDIIPVVFGSLSALKISLFCAASNNRLHRLLIGRRWNRCFLLLGESLGDDDAPASHSILLASFCVFSSLLAYFLTYGLSP